jgi:hypothetical protein
MILFFFQFLFTNTLKKLEKKVLFVYYYGEWKKIAVRSKRYREEDVKSRYGSKRSERWREAPLTLYLLALTLWIGDYRFVLMTFPGVTAGYRCQYIKR